MDEYVLADGTIKLGPECRGAVKFTDGHYEPVINVNILTKASFHFFTSTGVYSYEERYIQEDKLYCDPNPYVLFYPQHRFRKYDYETCEWTQVYNIERVYLYGPVFPELK